MIEKKVKMCGFCGRKPVCSIDDDLCLDCHLWWKKVMGEYNGLQSNN